MSHFAYHNHATDQSVSIPDVITRTVRPEIRRVTTLWGAFMLGLTLLMSATDGTFTEEGPVVAILTSVVMTLLTMAVVGGVLFVLAGIRGGPRVGAVQRAIVDELAEAEAALG